MRALLATPNEAGILSVKQNSEVLRIARLTRIPDGRVVEFTRSDIAATAMSSLAN